MYFCGGSSGRGSCGQGSRIHRGLCERRGGRGCRASHGRGFGRGGGHGEKKASHDKSKTPAPIEWKPLENLFENQNCTKPYLEAMDVQRYAVNTQSPLDHLLLLFPNELINQIVHRSNLYQQQIHQTKPQKKVEAYHKRRDYGFSWHQHWYRKPPRSFGLLV